MATALSRRCSTCSLNWPLDDRFDPCPVCGGRTWRDPSDEPMDWGEARELAGDDVAATTRDGKPRFRDYPRPRRSEAEVDREVEAFRAWLETTTADDFRDWP